MQTLVLLMLAGAAGTGLRYTTGLWLGRILGTALPWGTFAVNILGAFAIGYVTSLAAESKLVARELTLIITAGFLGGFTTFSAFALENQRMLVRKELGLMALYLGGTVVLGLMAVSFGSRLAGR